MPLLVLTLTPALRRQVDAAHFSREFASAAARIAGRQRKFICIKLAEGELSIDGELVERAWLLEFVAAEIITAETTAAMARGLYAFLGSALGTSEAQGVIEFRPLQPWASGTMGMTYAELEPQLRERAAQRRAEREGKEGEGKQSKL